MTQALGPSIMSEVGRMLVNIGPIKTKRGVPLPIRVPDRWPEPGELGDGVEAVAPVHLEGTVTNTGKAFYVDARLTTALNLHCSRCLREFRYEIDLPFVEEFHRRPKVEGEPGEGQRQVAPWDDDENAFAGDEIDLWEPVRETIALNVPIKALCREACAGLCPTCGRDLNEGRCDCPQPQGDPRLALLQQLLEELGDDEVAGASGADAGSREALKPGERPPSGPGPVPGRNGIAKR